MISRTKTRRRPWPQVGTTAMVLTCGLIAAQARGVDLATERGRVLTVIGSVRDVDIPLHPLASDPGLGKVQPVSDSTARSLRLHFKVEGGDGKGDSWGIRIKDGNDRPVWHTWAEEVQGTGFWSDEIEGNRARVEVYSARPENPVKLSIDRVAVRTPPTTPLSITGPNDLNPIGSQPSWIVGLGRSVARIRFEGDDGGSYVCTGFLVTPDLMLTNQHCISSRSEMDSALIDFDYDVSTATPETLRLRELLQTDVALDYSLVRLETPVDRAPLPLDPSPPPDAEALLIIQHPAGEPKQVSVRDCQVDGEVVQGRVAPGTDFGHLCDTKGGSSGSPVFRFGTRTVVGLHHLGFRSSSSSLFNRAVHIEPVLADLGPEARMEIIAAQPAP